MNKIGDKKKDFDQSEDVEAKLRLLNLAVTAKKIENSLFQKCMELCCNFDKADLEQKEINCLQNCKLKLKKFKDVNQRLYGAY